jgi:hypothetical protein
MRRVAEFLSPAWLAELDVVARSSAELAAVGREQPLVVEQRVTGAPAGDATYHLVCGPDGARIEPGPAARPDLVITTDYRTAWSWHRGTGNVQHALAEGGAKIGGDLIRLRAHAPQLAAIGDVFAALRGTTSHAEPLAHQPDLEQGE